MDRIEKISRVWGSAPADNNGLPRPPGQDEPPIGEAHSITSGDGRREDPTGILPSESKYVGASNVPYWVELLFERAREGKLNLDEFSDLAFYRLESERLGALLKSEVPAGELKKQMKSRRQVYRDRFDTYSREDLHPEPSSGDYRRLEAMDRLYLGIADGSVNLDEAAYLLKEHLLYSRLEGAALREDSPGGTGLTPDEAMDLENSAMDLENLTSLMEQKDYRY